MESGAVLGLTVPPSEPILVLQSRVFMRLLAVIVLTSLMMLAAFPQKSAAGSATHDCASCPEMLISADQQALANQPQADAPCAEMSICASYALLDNRQPILDEDLLRFRCAWPEPRNGTAISLSLDLPPPRV